MAFGLLRQKMIVGSDISDGVVFGSFGNESPVREVRNNDKS
jgi:hypothetical protein